MKRTDIEHAIGVLLLLSVIITGLLGYIQSQLELRKFIPHRYSAYVTLCLIAVHVYFNIGKIWKYFRRKIKDKG